MLFWSKMDSHYPNNTSIYEIECGVSKDNVRCNLTAVELININQILHGEKASCKFLPRNKNYQHKLTRKWVHHCLKAPYNLLK